MINSISELPPVPALCIWVGENPPTGWRSANALEAVNILDSGIVERLSLGTDGGVVLKILDKMIDAGRVSLPFIEFHTSSSSANERLEKMRTALQEKWRLKLN